MERSSDVLGANAPFQPELRRRRGPVPIARRGDSYAKTERKVESDAPPNHHDIEEDRTCPPSRRRHRGVGSPPRWVERPRRKRVDADAEVGDDLPHCGRVVRVAVSRIFGVCRAGAARRARTRAGEVGVLEARPRGTGPPHCDLGTAGAFAPGVDGKLRGDLRARPSASPANEVDGHGKNRPPR